ncbi:hypothetical protein BV22DRAFT_1199044 [Leucogyrophana mollusca]|uniref:Uncharacterized protein n=1 Tax=Leucogyrophana mollusca TaxID=85980 RepID=A0ACB8B4R6_9AGAM|nr:hypothetical protein BV22DRAFT_1199044 [Leucogyrophana mollusca]
MPSALASQLAASASLNSSLLLEHSRKRKQTSSYLFTARDADVHDLDSIHAIASNAFTQLCALSPELSSNTTKSSGDGTAVNVDFEQVLFSDAARAMDRTMQTKDINAALDRTLHAFLRLLGPWLLEAPTGKVLEWLVRRFRINEFNVDDILVLFLPYHESPHFVKMLSILEIKPTSPFAFLLPFKATAKPLARSILVKNMISNSDVARFVSSLLPDAIRGAYSHRALLGFSTATMHDYLSSHSRFDEGTLAFVLPALMGPLQALHGDLNTTLGSYVLLSTLSHKTPLSSAAVSAIITTMANAAAHRGKQPASMGGQVPAAHFVKAAVAICSPQEDAISFHPSTGNLCLKTPRFVDELRDALGYVGTEKFALPLLESLKARLNEPPVSALYAAVVNTSKAPEGLVKRVAALLVRVVVSGEVESAASARALLSLVHQRHFGLLRDVASTVVEETADATEAGDSTKGRKKKVDELLLSFSVTHPWAQNSDINEIVVASTSSTKEVRVEAVEKLYEILKEAGEGSVTLESSDLASVQSALFARLYDTHPGVLHVLYSSPSLFLSTVAPTTSPTQILDTIIAQLMPAPPARPILRAHVAFLVGAFSSAYPDLRHTVQEKALFPFLLASKAKFRTALGVWEAVKESSGFSNGWMNGCVDIWDDSGLFRAGKRDDEEDVEKICAANLGIAAKIAENILASNDSSADIPLVLAKLHDPLPHGRALAYLVARALLLRSSGNQQIGMACRLLHAMRLGDMGVFDGLAEQDIGLQEVLSDESVGMKATLKPGGRTTVQVLQASILALVPALKRPDDTVDWFASPTDVLHLDSLSSGALYVNLVRSVYTLAASPGAAAPSTLSTSLLKALFLSLRDDSLAFLLGVLTSRSPSAEPVHTHALLHTLAFLRSHTSANAVDFQTVVPSLVSVLMDARTDKQRRALVFECLATLAAEDDKKHVYGLDTIYGLASANLQYLDAKDLTVYLKSLGEQREQLVQDPDYIKVFHQQHFANANAKYRRRVLCFLLSHVIAHPSPEAKVALLQSIEAVSDSSKPHMLLPQVEELTQKSVDIGSRFGAAFDEYVALVIAAFVTMPSADLNEQKDNTTWPVFIAALRCYLQSNSIPIARVLFGEALEKGLFAGLILERRAEICIVMLQAGTSGGEAYITARDLLSKLLNDIPLIVHLLNYYQPVASSPDGRASKRARFDGELNDGSAEDGMASLILLAEILASKELPSSLDLISHLLDTLNKIMHQELESPPDISYVSQMLMATVEKVAAKVKEAPVRGIRLDILVEIIRVSDNPQTFHQALLLMATLARLTPESVLHNIMPVFTFMGSNVFHRDDSYSFKVVQKTIENIVPVMASSLKNKYTHGLELYVGARDFLRIFTDASNHIPRHRRSNFFVHLVNVLGPEEFLVPICMLLVDKSANRVSRQNAEEAQNQLALPLSILHHFAAPLQLFVLTEVLRESRRLVSRIMVPDSTGVTFLDYPRDEEHSASTSSTFKRRAQALIIFTSYAMQPSTQDMQTLKNGTTTDLISLLIDLTTARGENAQASGVPDIAVTAQTTITKVMEVMWAVDFLTAILTMLQSDDSRIKSGALQLLAKRVSEITETARRDSLATTKQIVDSIHDIISRQSAGELVDSALNALRSVGSTVCPGEEAPLTTTIPSLLKIIQARTSAASALGVLPCYVTGLGPRIIPYFRDIVQECLSILRENIKGKWQQSTAEGDALSTLQSLLSSLPAFYGEAELTQVTTLYLEYSAAASELQSNPMAVLVKAIAKRAPAKVLLPVMYGLWPKIDKSQKNANVNSFIGYFELFKRCLRAAPRAEVLEHLRPIFQVFVEAFGVNMTSGSLDGESSTISAFMELVVQLNENAFRPLFRRLYDWAFVSETTHNKQKITFCRVYMALLDYFKGLMNPYMSLVLQPLCDILHSFTVSPSEDALWLCAVETLTKSFESDDGVFWRDDKLRSVATPLIAQVPNCVKLNIADAKKHLTRCLSAMTGAVNDDALLKTINLNILMHTRSEDARERIFALSCSEALWKEHGGKLIGFVAETATFISECAEDENDTVVREVHKLKNAVESVAGSISGL